MIFSLDDNKKCDEEAKDKSPDLEAASFGEDPSVKHRVRSTTTRSASRTIVVLILLLGCAASAAFLTIGMLNALQDSQQAFETDVEQLAVRVHNAFREYETAALWVHQFCHSHKKQPATTPNGEPTFPFASNFRSLFRSLYDTVVAKGLPLHAIQYIPRVTREERDVYEAETQDFYQQYYPSVAANYSGLSGFVPDDTVVPLGLSLAARVPQDIYFPVHFVEPVLDNVGVVDFDVYSEDYPRWAVDTAMSTKQPVITGRLRLIQEPDPSPDAFSVLLMHPGLANDQPSYGHDDPAANSTTQSGDVSLIAIRIPSLLRFIATQEQRYENVAQSRMPPMKVYLYDSTPNDPTLEEPLYLGGTKMDLQELEQDSMQYLPQTKLADLEHQASITPFFYKIRLEIGLRQWTLACVAGEEAYPPKHTFAIVGGVMILLAFLCLGLWVYTQMSRAAQLSQLKAKAQEEQATLRIHHARQAAAAERQLNEFIAHEVRNPLAAAMSACSFVTSAIEEGNGLFQPSAQLPRSVPPSPPATANQESMKPLFRLPPEEEYRSKPLFQLPGPTTKASNSESATLTPLFSIPPTSSSSTTEKQAALPAPLLELPTQSSISSAPNVKTKPTNPLLPLLPKPREQALSSQSSNQQQQHARDKVMADLHIIDSSLQFVNELLRNMLDVQRAACHQLKVQKGPTDILRDILEPVDAMLYRRGRNSVEVIIDCPYPQLLAEADRLRLKQVVLNLGRNASKFVNKGYVKFKVVLLPPQEPPLPSGNSSRSMNKTAFSGQSKAASVQIWVEDTGVGIPQEKKGKLFAKFQDSLDSLSQGTGLGLSLCKILVQLMGGNIWLDETYHSGFDDRPGSRFIIDLNAPPMDVTDDCYEEEHSAINVTEQDDTESSLCAKARKRCAINGMEISSTETTRVELEGPMDDDTRMRVFSTVSTSSRRGSSPFVNPQLLPAELSVLFVDDDTVLRKLLVRAVRAISPAWTLHEAASGEAALRLIGEHSFDLIFMDQYMASTEKQLLGTETTQALRSKGVRSKICGLSAKEMGKDFFAAGANAFVCKPLPTKKFSLHQILCEILLGEIPEIEGAHQLSSLVMTPTSDM